MNSLPFYGIQIFDRPDLAGGCLLLPRSSLLFETEKGLFRDFAPDPRSFLGSLAEFLFIDTLLGIIINRARRRPSSSSSTGIE